MNSEEISTVYSNGYSMPFVNCDESYKHWNDINLNVNRIAILFHFPLMMLNIYLATKPSRALVYTARLN